MSTDMNSRMNNIQCMVMVCASIYLGLHEHLKEISLHALDKYWTFCACGMNFPLIISKIYQSIFKLDWLFPYLGNNNRLALTWQTKIHLKA